MRLSMQYPGRPQHHTIIGPASRLYFRDESESAESVALRHFQHILVALVPLKSLEFVISNALRRSVVPHSYRNKYLRIDSVSS